MKRFELTLISHKSDKIEFFEKAEADTLLELMAKLLLIVVKLQPKEVERKEINDDDIPF